MQTDNPTPKAAMVEVTQADREAAISFGQDAIVWRFFEGNERDMRAGSYDDERLIQAFAHHRLAAIQSGPPPVAGEGALREAANLSELATAFEAPGRITHPTGPNSEVAAMLRRAASTLATGGTESWRTDRGLDALRSLRRAVEEAGGFNDPRTAAAMEQAAIVLGRGY